jgi:hypothetical protein
MGRHLGGAVMSASPIFVAFFADGQTTRLSTCCTKARLDLARGVKLARHAYRSRTGKSPPAISKAHFVDPFSGKMLKEYDAAQIVGLLALVNRRSEVAP